MKYKVGTTGDEIEIGQYREVNKGSLKAFFSVVIYSPPPFIKGDKMLDCRYFVQGDKRWFSFPQKEVKYTDGRKTEYIPYRSFLDKEYLEQLKIAILAALKEAKPQEKHGQAQNPSYQGQTNSLPSETSFDWGNPPF